MSGMREYVCTVYLLHKYSFVQNSGSCLQTLITEDEAEKHHLFFAHYIVLPLSPGCNLLSINIHNILYYTAKPVFVQFDRESSILFPVIPTDLTRSIDCHGMIFRGTCCRLSKSISRRRTVRI